MIPMILASVYDVYIALLPDSICVVVTLIYVIYKKNCVS